MREVDSTGTLKAGEKALAELRKRKLIVQKYDDPCHIITRSADYAFIHQEGTMVHRTQGHQFQHIDSQTGDRFDSRHADFVSIADPDLRRG